MLQVKVNLKEYPAFWNALRIAQHHPIINGVSTVEQLIERVFGFTVTAPPQDKAGTVIMDAPTFTWFELKWN